MKRLYDYAIGTSDFQLEKFRKDFVNFVDDYDKRRNLNFKETFPELVGMYNETKKLIDV